MCHIPRTWCTVVYLTIVTPALTLLVSCPAAHLLCTSSCLASPLLLLAIIRKFPQPLLEQCGLKVEILVCLMQGVLTWTFLLQEGMDLELDLLVQSHVGITDGMQDKVVFTRVDDLNAELFLQDSLQPHDSFEMDDPRLRGFNQEQPPLLEVRLRKERCVHWSLGFALSQTCPNHPHAHRGDVAHNTLVFILHINMRLDGDRAQVRTESFNICHLIRIEVREEQSPLRRGLGQEVLKLDHGRSQCPTSFYIVGSEVGSLQQRRTPHIKGLQQATSELQHCLRACEPLFHTGNLDHCLCEAHRMPKHVLCVLSQLSGHVALVPLHVSPDQKLVLHHNRLYEHRSPVLNNTIKPLDVRVVRLSQSDLTTLGTRS
mmetsp:Transcript_46349/g.123105  ORF Transcript_46349/g.123105 Transcript_46349/m.123105 type:complete len:372 (+) Transcript_46349:277-1392(+)